MTTAQLTEKIAELEATQDALVASDEGTHSGPTTYRTYEKIDDSRYTAKRHAGATIGLVSEQFAEDNTEGHIRIFPNATKEIRVKAKELKELKKLAQ